MEWNSVVGGVGHGLSGDIIRHAVHPQCNVMQCNVMHCTVRYCTITCINQTSDSSARAGGRRARFSRRFDGDITAVCAGWFRPSASIVSWRRHGNSTRRTLFRPNSLIFVWSSGRTFSAEDDDDDDDDICIEI